MKKREKIDCCAQKKITIGRMDEVNKDREIKQRQEELL